MASKSITADISYYVTIDEERIVKRQRLFQCNNNNNDHNLNVQQQITSKVLSRSSSLQILAKTWLSHYNNTNMRSSLLNDIIELKRKLLFSIDQFVQFLDLSTIPSKDILPLLIAYHTWSKLTYGTLMPLMALLFPLIQMDINNITINNNNNGNDSSTLIDCFHRVQDETVLQDYLEAIIHYLHFNILNSMIEKERLEKEKQKSNIILVQSWMDKLLEQDRKNIAFYSISGNNHSSCSSLYLTYYDVFLDKDRLKYLSWNDKKRWIMKEWDSWIQFLIGNNKNVDNDDNQMQLWMQEKINIIHYGDKLDKQYLMLIEKNMLWFNEFNSNISSSLISYTADLLLMEKIVPITMVWSIYHYGCNTLINTGQDSLYIVKVLEDIKDAIIQHLSNKSDIIAVLLSIVQISLYYMSSILTYQQWFEINFVKEDKQCLQTKRQFQLWMIHLENMIPYEIPTILQTQAKVYSNMNGSLANNYVTLVKRKLLVLGIDSSLRNYPTNIFMKDNGTNNSNSLNSIDNPTDINNNINNNNNTIKIDSSHYSQLTNNSDINNNNLNSGIHISDLEKLLKAYNETNMVPKELWEDSIFRPKWFKLTFVPALMNWKLTDKKMIENRYQLIEALNAKRKIPTSLYQQFINKK